MRDPILAIHVAAGAAALILGALAVAGGQRPRERLGLAYQAAVALVVASAVILSALDLSSFWWLIVLALATEAAALGGLYLAHTGGHRVLRTHLLGGSYVALVTALLVVSWDSPLAWALPTALGVPAIVAYHERLRPT